MNSVSFSCVLLTLLFKPDLIWGHGKGLSYEGIGKRIVGGQIAQPYQFPYQARLILTRFVNGQYSDSICGGSIISDRAIITAAHCIDGVLSGVVQLGTTNIQIEEPTTRITVRVSKENFIIHENFNPQTVENDVALIIIPAVILFNPGVQPILLPRASQVNLVNQWALLSGFGKLGNKLDVSTELRFIQRLILPDSHCYAYFPIHFKQSQICVDGSGGQSACQGDSGGPLALQEPDGSRTLVGLTSYGKVICEDNGPVVYTRLTSYLSWIYRYTGIPIRP